jgi:HD-like signal output (HDOD) protein
MFLSLGERYSEALSKEFTDLEESLSCEKELFGVTHCEVGHQLAGNWGFPAKLGTYMTQHHENVEGKPNDPMTLIRTACQLADALGFPEVSRQNSQQPAAAEGLRALPRLEPEFLKFRITKRIAEVGGPLA